MMASSWVVVIFYLFQMTASIETSVDLTDKGFAAAVTRPSQTKRPLRNSTKRKRAMVSYALRAVPPENRRKIARLTAFSEHEGPPSECESPSSEHDNSFSDRECPSLDCGNTRDTKNPSIWGDAGILVGSLLILQFQAFWRRRRTIRRRAPVCHQMRRMDRWRH